MLEYYHGVLFLTTNQIGTFDEAFMSLHCYAFSAQDKGKIRNTLLGKALVGDFPPDKLLELATLDLNWRKIRKGYSHCVKLGGEQWRES